jgi:ankyrin repeat protein
MKTINKNLLKAAAKSGVSRIHTLLDKGADINVTDSLGKTPLILAAEKNPNVDVTILLIEEDKKTNGIDIYGGSPLLNATDKTGDSALMKAAWSNPNMEVFTALLLACAEFSEG